jgi:hypothetical protein
MRGSGADVERRSRTLVADDSKSLSAEVPIEVGALPTSVRREPPRLAGERPRSRAAAPNPVARTTQPPAR